MKQLVRVAGTALAVAAFAFAPLGHGKVHAIASCPTDLLSGYTPDNTNWDDSNSVNVGVVFHVNGAPFITGVKFYKGVDNTGTHVAHLRETGGASDLASVTYTSETTSGWQTVYFDSPVATTGAYSYTLWVSMPNGHYAVDGEGIGNDHSFDQYYGGTMDPVQIWAGDSAVWTYSSDDSDVPSNESSDNFWVSPIVDDTIAPNAVEDMSVTDHTAGPTVEWGTPGYDTNGTYDLAAPVLTTIARSDGVTSDVVGQQYGGDPYWMDGGDPQNDTTALPGTSYTYTVTSTDACGNVSDEATDSVATASQSLDHIFSEDPENVDTGQTSANVMGMHWQTSNAGYVWGIRFYRGSGTTLDYPNGGHFQVTLWDNDHTSLATQAVAHGNQQTGWIDVRFSSPVAVSANHDYIVSYFSPNGQESYSEHTFDSAVTNGDLTARADTSFTPNAVYATGSGTSASSFPNSRAANADWFGVDVDFYE